jgi:hypothetical protein
MKWKLSSFILIVCLVFRPLSVFAHDTRYLNPKYRIWTDTVEVVRNGKEFSLSSDTTNQNQSTSIVDYQSQNFSKYNGLVLTIESDGPINFTLLFKSNNEYRYQEEDTLLLIEDETKMIHRLSQNYGVYAINQAFKGRIYLPFNNFKENLNNLEFWSLVLVQNADETLNIKIDSIQLLNGIDSEWYDTKLKEKVISETEIQIPVQGESMLILPKLNARYFTLEKENIGSRIEENKLIIDKTVIEGEISLIYVDEEGYRMRLPIKTYQSWIVNETANGISIAFPDTTTNLKELFNQWFDTRFTPYIQAGIGLIGLLFALFYRYKRIKRKVNKNVI